MDDKPPRARGHTKPVLTPADGSGLSHDASMSSYVYVGKSDNAWAGTCRRLVVTLTDGSQHTAGRLT